VLQTDMMNLKLIIGGFQNAPKSYFSKLLYIHVAEEFREPEIQLRCWFQVKA